MTCGIYSIKNKLNGKLYIGSSVNIELRWKIHTRSLRKGSHHSKYLQRAWNKDGESAFVFEVLLDLGDSVADNLFHFEQIALNAFKSADKDFGYNVGEVAGSRRGVPHSEAAREKMRRSAERRAPVSDDTRRLLSRVMKDKVERGELFGEEHRAKISESLKGRPISEETRTKIGDASKGRAVSEDTRAKLSLANKGRKLSADQYERLLERSKTTNKITPEIRAKQTAARQETLRQRRAAVAPRVLELRNSGLSYAQICRQFEAEGVKTLTGNHKWFEPIVRTIYLEASASAEQP